MKSFRLKKNMKLGRGEGDGNFGKKIIFFFKEVGKDLKIEGTLYTRNCFY